MAVISIWGDESSHTGHHYMVLGTIWEYPAGTANLQNDVFFLRMQNNFFKEFHWSSMQKIHLDLYKDLIRIFKKYMDQGMVKFRALLVDQTDILHKKWSKDDEEHFYKMWFWLIYKRLRKEHEYDIFLDRKENKMPLRLQDLGKALNNRWLKEYGHLNDHKNIIRMVEPRDGSQIQLQIADVFAGAIAYVRNGAYEKAKTKNNHKVQLVDFIEEYLEISLSSCHKPWESDGFHIWCFERTKN